MNLQRYTCAPAEGDYGAGMEPCSDGDYVSYDDAMEAINGLQARIDSLMLEHCPDEMTEQQMTEWAKHQVAACVECSLSGKSACPEHGTK